MPDKLYEQYRLPDTMSIEKGELRVGKARMILFSANAYAILVSRIYEHAPQAVRAILYDAGYQVGEEYMKTLKGTSPDTQELLKHAIKTFQQSGYGEFSLEEYNLDQSYARIRGVNLFEAVLAGEMGIYHSPRAVDHYSCGMLAGLFSQLLGKEAVCDELYCAARGDQACEFVIMPFVLD